MSTSSTLRLRILDHLPVLGVNMLLVGAVGYTVLKEPLDHTALIAGCEVVGGVFINTALYLANDKYRIQVKRMKWSLGFYPKGMTPRRLDDMLEFILFLLRDPAQVSQCWWTITKYLKGNKVFGPRYAALIQAIYEQLVEAKKEGARIRIAGVKPAHETMSRMYNDALSEPAGVMELYTISSGKAKHVNPAMFIKLRSGECFVFDDLIFPPDASDSTRCACSKSNPRHVVRVKNDIEKLMKPFTRVDPIPNIFPPAPNRKKWRG